MMRYAIAETGALLSLALKDNVDDVHSSCAGRTTSSHKAGQAATVSSTVGMDRLIRMTEAVLIPVARAITLMD